MTARQQQDSCLGEVEPECSSPFIGARDRGTNVGVSLPIARELLLSYAGRSKLTTSRK